MSTLAEAQKGQQATVGQILGSENQIASLAKFGIVPGAPVSVENVSKIRQTVDIVIAGHHRTLPFKVAAIVEIFDGAAPAPAPAPAFPEAAPAAEPAAPAYGYAPDPTDPYAAAAQAPYAAPPAQPKKKKSGCLIAVIIVGVLVIIFGKALINAAVVIMGICLVLNGLAELNVIHRFW